MADIDRKALRELAEAATPGPWNAAFIAAAREAVPALLDALDAAESEVARLRATLQRVAAMNSHSGPGAHCTCSQRERTDTIHAAINRARKGGT